MARRQRFQHRSVMPASAAATFAWHLRPEAFEDLVPPSDGTRLVSRTGALEDNSLVVEVSVPVLGPIRQTWRMRHEDFTPGRSFADVMDKGPFPYWRHEHRVEPIDDTSSELIDTVEYELPLGIAGRLVGGPIVASRLARLFPWRHAKTRESLEGLASG